MFSKKILEISHALARSCVSVDDENMQYKKDMREKETTQ